MHVRRAAAFVLLTAMTSLVFACGGRLLQNDSGDDDIRPSANDATAPGPDSATHSRDATVDGNLPTTPHDAGPPPAGWNADATATGCTPQPRFATESESVSFQIDSEHTGSQPSDRLTLPLCRRWAQTFAGKVSYPLIADGRVFVVVNGGSSEMDLYALDELTGAIIWGPIAVDFGGAAAAAYDNGTVYVAGSELEAYDAVNGSQRWSTSFFGSLTRSAPTARDGVVYVAALGGAVSAFSSDGGTRWSTVAGGNNFGPDAPTVDSARVYTGAACGQALDINDGGVLWLNPLSVCSHDTTGPFGSSGIALGTLFLVSATNNGATLDLATGAFEGESDVGMTMPAGLPNWMISVQSSTNPSIQNLVDAFKMTSPSFSVEQWQFNGDGQIASNVLIVGNNVVVGSSAGRLYVLDLDSGTQVGGDVLDQPLSENLLSEDWPLASPAEADGMLLVPAGTSLTAY